MLKLLPILLFALPLFADCPPGTHSEPTGDITCNWLNGTFMCWPVSTCVWDEDCRPPLECYLPNARAKDKADSKPKEENSTPVAPYSPALPPKKRR